VAVLGINFWGLVKKVKNVGWQNFFFKLSVKNIILCETAEGVETIFNIGGPLGANFHIGDESHFAPPREPPLGG